MNAVILAGGMGKRCLPLSIYEPKFMWPFLGKPLIFYLINQIKENGITDIIIVLGEESEEIKEIITSAYPDLKFTFTFQETPLGQADALRTAEKFVDEHFIVFNANDIFPSILIGKIIAKFSSTKSDIIVVGKKTKEFSKYGFFKIENGKVTGVIEKPVPENAPSDIAAIGIWLLPRKIFDEFRKYPAEEYLFEKAYGEMLKQNGAELVMNEDYFESYKMPQDILKMNDLFMSFIAETKISKSAQISEKATIQGKVIIEDNVKILENAVIRGPCYIGKNTIIGNNALIWNNVNIEENSVIGNLTEIKHSYLGHDVWAHMSYVGDSIIEHSCNLGAGTVFCNYRFDEKNIFINVKDKKIDTGSNKFGAVMAAYCKTGSNSTLMPGINVGPNSLVYPGTLVKDDLQANKILKDTGEILDNNINLKLKEKSEIKNKLSKSLFS